MVLAVEVDLRQVVTGGGDPVKVAELPEHLQALPLQLGGLVVRSLRVGDVRDLAPGDGGFSGFAEPLEDRQLDLAADPQRLVVVPAPLGDVGDLASGDGGGVGVAEPLEDRQDLDSQVLTIARQPPRLTYLVLQRTRGGRSWTSASKTGSSSRNYQPIFRRTPLVRHERSERWAKMVWQRLISYGWQNQAMPSVERSMALVLSVEDYAGPCRWRWLLRDEDSGRPLADHHVDMDASSDEYAAFTSLYRYLRWNAVPDRRTASEAEIVGRIGVWSGREALGQTIGQVIADAAPVNVRVVVPPEAGFLLGWPLEMAHVKGMPLAARGDVTFVYDLQNPPASESASTEAGSALPGARPVRLLAVFSLPTETSVLALRRERRELARLIRRIGTRERQQIEATFLQYGVTRQRLARVVDSGDGWDVLHLSGHGGVGSFLLETEDGSRDQLDTGELVEILRPLRRRVRLAVVSACESAAATTAETLRWVGLTERAERLELRDAAEFASRSHGDREPEDIATGIGRALVTKLGCATVAMRYPVTDDFAIAFTEKLYERLLGRHGQSLGVAVARAVREAAGERPSAARPAICIGTPVLIGRHAAELQMPTTRGKPLLNPADVRMERFPAEPERFVGRAREMAQASVALAAGSDLTGVLLHGMVGSGKTACALELAYRHHDSFEAVAFWQAPEQHDEFSGALASLAAALEIQLGDYGFAMADKITTIASLEKFLPRLTRVLEDNGILLVLDNLEALLTSDGVWRDLRWGPLIAALTAHRGESRVILTSRIRPVHLASTVVILPVHALSLDESAALARELPGLRKLLHADASPLRDPDEGAVAADRDMVRRVLRVVQGHPKLMELADAASTERSRLEAQLAAAESAAANRVLEAFFHDGTTSLKASEFLQALAGWTSAALTGLPGPTRLMAQVLAFLEDDDRTSWIIERNWADIWRRLGQVRNPPGHRPQLDALTRVALVQSDLTAAENGDGAPVRACRMHPGIAEAIRATADPGVQDATDQILAAFWTTIAERAIRLEGTEGGESGQSVIQAGLRAAPYLIRLQAWETAVSVLEESLRRERSPATRAVIVSLLKAVTDTTRNPLHLAVLGRALRAVDPARAEALLRASLTELAASEEWASASAIAGDLSDVLTEAGRLHEALDLTEERAAYTRRSELGPWTQIAGQAQRLQILSLMGEHQQVLGQVPELLTEMDTLPGHSGGKENATPWYVRETTLNAGYASALALGRSQQCLDLNAAILASKQARGVSDYELAFTRLNDSGPLEKLGRLDEADAVLAGCQQVFEDHGDIIRLARVLGIRATIQSDRGNYAAAVALHRTAARYFYTRPDPRDVATCHFNLASDLDRAGSEPAARRAHLVAALLIFQIVGMAHLFGICLPDLARDIARHHGHTWLPGTLGEIIEVAEQDDGVRLGDLITNLQPDRQAAEEALARILAAAVAMPADQDNPPSGPGHMD